MKFLIGSLFLFLCLPTFAANELVNNAGNDVQLGDVVVGQSKDFTFTLSNSGTQKISFYEFFLDFTKGQINFSDNGDFPGGGTCNGPEIPAGGSCTYIMKFKPAQLVSLKSNFKINYFYGNKLQKLTIVFRGTGVTAPPPPKPALLKIDGSSPYDFGTLVVGASARSAIFTMTNTGELEATSIVVGALTEPFAFLGGAFPGTGGTCLDTLPAGETCSFVVVYQPTITGMTLQDLMFSYFDGSMVQALNHQITGVGISPATLTLGMSGSFDFGKVKLGQSKEAQFSVVNTGAAPATDIMISGLSDPFWQTQSTCFSELLPGKSCQIKILFEPKTIDSFKGRMALTYNNGAFMDGIVQTFVGSGTKKK